MEWRTEKDLFRLLCGQNRRTDGRLSRERRVGVSAPSRRFPPETFLREKIDVKGGIAAIEVDNRFSEVVYCIYLPVRR